MVVDSWWVVIVTAFVIAGVVVGLQELIKGLHKRADQRRTKNK